MSDEKDRVSASVHPLPKERHRRPTPDPLKAADHMDDPVSDPLLDALRHAAEDMLKEPVPDRLLEALNNKRDQ